MTTPRSHHPQQGKSPACKSAWLQPSLQFSCVRSKQATASTSQAGPRATADTQEGGPQPQGRVAEAAERVLTSSSRRRCSFCSSMRFWRSASSCRLCSSFSRCCCSSCCRRRASDRSLLASWSLRKSRRSVDSPGRFRMELRVRRDRSGSRSGRGHRYRGSRRRRARRVPHPPVGKEATCSSTGSQTLR